jgi:MFS family permease
MVAVLRRSPTAWLLGAFYFLTFGGFVAFSIYLPTLLRAQFGLVPADAGFRAAGFVVLATLMRPLGGWLADRIGGAQVLSWVFGGVSLFALLLMGRRWCPSRSGRLSVRCSWAWGTERCSSSCQSTFPGTRAPSPDSSAHWEASAGSSHLCSLACFTTGWALSGQGSCSCR